MAPKLVIEEGDQQGLSFSLEEGEQWAIGRNPEECQFVIEDPQISRKHLLLQRSPEGITAQNVSHTNPIEINGEPLLLEESHLLENGDTVKMGSELLRYYDASEAQMMEEDYELSFAEEEPVPETTQPPPEEPMGKEQTSIEENITEEPILASPQHTIFGDEEGEIGQLAEIDFGIAEEGRWLLKVVGGPNAGAEFHMKTGNHYILGTDPKTNDIVFHDTSVSRQHARISISSDDELTVEDLHSRNGVLIAGVRIEHKQILLPSTIITLGTTSFIIYDREGEMQTIISPLLPSIVKVLQQDGKTPSQEEEEGELPSEMKESLSRVDSTIKTKEEKSFVNYVILSAILGLFALALIGTSSLFRSEPIALQTEEHADELIKNALYPFPAVRYTFNKGNDTILLIGHIATLAEKNQLLFNVQALKFIKGIDDTGIVIDETVWHEMNSILADNPAWHDISVHSPRAGQFILSGYLQTRKQAEQLSTYMNLNFPYLDLLTRQIVVEEDVINKVTEILQNNGFLQVVPKMNNGEVVLTGVVPQNRPEGFAKAIAQIKNIPGVRIVTNTTKTQMLEPDVINITDQYQIIGKSQVGQKFTVVINGRILSEGDDLDGMSIISITRNRIMLEKGGQKYRIDY